MRMQAIGGPYNGRIDYHKGKRVLEPILLPYSEDMDRDTLNMLWSNILDGVEPESEHIGMYVPAIVFYDRVIYFWAGTEADPNRWGKQWDFAFPRVQENLTKEEVATLYQEERNRLVWVTLHGKA